MKSILPIILLIISIIGCVNQNSQTNSSKDKEVKKEKFVWGFNSKNIYTYSFEQVTNSINLWGDDIRDIDTSRVIGTGELKVKSKGNDKADFVLNLRIEHDAFKEVNPPQTMVIPDIDTNGQFDSKRRNSVVMFELIFPLPSKDLKIGESEKLNLEIPFNLMGSPLYVKGYNELKYLKDTSPNTALIKSEFKIDELDVPKEIKGEFMCSFIGNAEIEFNYKEKHFKSSQVDFQIKMKSKVDTGENAMGKVNMDMSSTNKYDIKFIEIEK
jgi:hypothetical protein